MLPYSGGQVTAGAHTPDIQTSTSPLVPTTSPPGCLTSVLSVTPATDGDHHVCFDVTDTVRSVEPFSVNCSGFYSNKRLYDLLHLVVW